MTNGEKFKEVFGVRPREVCAMPFLICKEQDSCESCPFIDFWNKEYKHFKLFQDKIGIRK